MKPNFSDVLVPAVFVWVNALTNIEARVAVSLVGVMLWGFVRMLEIEKSRTP